MLDTIKQVHNKVDILVVSIHWGKELGDYPGPDQTTLAKLMVDNGADIILGHHSHCLQVVEIYQKKPIIYSTGNFVFTSSTNSFGSRSTPDIRGGCENHRNKQN
ncbi:hypothetical protein JCM14036_01610 [Desulfotomaculum defluvii]